MHILDALNTIHQQSVPGDWEVGESGFIRHARTGECPVCFLARVVGANREGHTVGWFEVYAGAGLSWEDARAIANGADWKGYGRRGDVEWACHIPR